MIDHNDYASKYSFISTVKTKLKKEIIGIDTIIDNIVDNISPWYINNSFYKKPLVMNIWGPTGVGKTFLLKELAKSFDIPLLEIDMGQFHERSGGFNEFLYRNISDYINRPVFILLDEFQNCKTISSLGGDIERPYLRSVWQLINDGSLGNSAEFRYGTHYRSHSLRRLLLIQNWFEELWALLKDVSNEEEFNKIYEKWLDTFDLYNSDREHISEIVKSMLHTKNKIKSLRGSSVNCFLGRLRKLKDTSSGFVEEDLVLPKDLMIHIACTCNHSIDEINNNLTNDFLNKIKMYIKILEKSPSTVNVNFSKTIIFIVGNLDDLHSVSKTIDPDMSSDLLFDISKDTYISKVKEILLRHFKPEQVSRLGNNHVIVPFISEKNYKKIIDKNIKEVISDFKEHGNLEIKLLDNSIKQLIYDEGVFPSQGARPLMSTIESIFRFSVYSFIRHIIVNNLYNPPLKFSVKYDKKNNNIEYFIDGKNVFIHSPELKLSPLRKPVNNNFNTLVSAHEAGHTICEIVLLGQYPKKITAFSASEDRPGFTMHEYNGRELITKSYIYNDIIVSLGGYAAEFVLFGKDNITCSSVMDLQKATQSAVRYVESYGLMDDEVFISSRGTHDEDCLNRNTERENKIKKIVSNALNDAIDTIKQHKIEVVDLATEILKKEFLVSEEIQKILSKYNIQPVNSFDYKTKLIEMYNQT